MLSWLPLDIHVKQEINHCKKSIVQQGKLDKIMGELSSGDKSCSIYFS